MWEQNFFTLTLPAYWNLQTQVLIVELTVDLISRVLSIPDKFWCEKNPEITALPY